jgi:hypothetical protein
MKSSLLGTLLLAACMQVAPPGEVTRAAPAGPAVEASVPAPEGAPPGTCWTQDLAVDPVDRVLAEALEAPAGGEAVLFETPCAYEMTAELIGSLQRALAARDLYDGTDSGKLDAGTREAIRAWQRPRGLNSGVLAMRTARELGLIPYPTEAAERLKRLPRVIPAPPEPPASGVY